MKTTTVLKLFMLAAAAVPGHAAVFTASGATPADIQSAVNNFRTALGANNGVGGSFVGGRREINWDGVPDNLATPNLMPADFFNTTSPRGVLLSGPVGFEVSATAASGTGTLFSNIDASYASQFQAFSAERIFRNVGGNTIQIDFVIPGTNTPTFVTGFGAVFTDAELAGQTLFTLTLGNGSNGGQFAVPVSSSGGLSFLGLTDPNGYSRVIIKLGTTGAGSGVLDNPGGGVDIVFVDDFIYGEPFNANAGSGVPEPASMLLTGAGAAAVWFVRRRR